MESQVKRVNAIFPWFSGLTGDLLFFVAVNTIFLTVEKGLNTFEISLLSTVSLVLCLILQKIIFKFIKKIGNTTSMRIGTGSLVIASLLITFGNNLFTLIIGYIFYELAWFFKSVESVILKNNLKIEKRENDYMELKTKSSMIYAVITAVIAFVSGFLFNYNHYLPMYLCIISSISCFLLSFYLKEFKEKDKKEQNVKEKNITRINLSKTIWLIIFTFSIFFTAINIGQSDSKLLIQYELTNNYGITLTATVMSIIIAISRIARIIGNFVFNRMYNRLKDKVSIVLSMLLLLSFVLLILGYFIPKILVLKFVLMSIGFFFILGIRDPFRNYIQDLMLRVVDKRKQETAIYYLEVIRKTVNAFLKIIVTMLLAKIELIYIIFFLLILSIIELCMTVKLYRIILKKEVIKESLKLECESI